MLQSSGELWPLARVFAYQATHADALYLRATDQVFYAYKYRGIVLRRPSILVAGSSRTMKFRAQMFGTQAASFYNAGGLLNSARDIADLAERLAAQPDPALLVLGVDLWWFNDGVRPAYNFDAETTKDPGRSFDEHVLALRWLVLHPRSWMEEAASALHRSRPDDIGIAAREGGSGFRPDGSYASAVPVPASADGFQFVDREQPPIIERVTAASEGFPPADRASDARIAALDQALERLAARHVLVVGYLPPFSSAVLDALQHDRRHAGLWRDFASRVPDAFQRHDFPVVDASDPRRFGMDDRAMIDGVHADETFHLHVIDAMLTDVRVRDALPGAAAAVARALASPRTNFWRADLGS